MSMTGYVRVLIAPSVHHFGSKQNFLQRQKEASNSLRNTITNSFFLMLLPCISQTLMLIWWHRRKGEEVKVIFLSVCPYSLVSRRERVLGECACIRMGIKTAELFLCNVSSVLARKKCISMHDLWKVQIVWFWRLCTQGKCSSTFI